MVVCILLLHVITKASYKKISNVVVFFLYCQHNCIRIVYKL
jgi:hypothetical protein